MPKVKITDSKGLVVEKGSGLEVFSSTSFLGATEMKGSTMTGARRRVVLINEDAYGDDSSIYQLSGSDSGTLFIIGDVAAGRTIMLPASVGSGWNATFVATGSLTSAREVKLSGSFANCTWVGNVVETTSAGASDSIVPTAAGGVVFNEGGGQLLVAGDRLDVEVMDRTAAGGFVVHGLTTN